MATRLRVEQALMSVEIVQRTSEAGKKQGLQKQRMMERKRIRMGGSNMMRSDRKENRKNGNR
jgi:hypothetical protein